MFNNSKNPVLILAQKHIPDLLPTSPEIIKIGFLPVIREIRLIFKNIQKSKFENRISSKSLNQFYGLTRIFTVPVISNFCKLAKYLLV